METFFLALSSITSLCFCRQVDEIVEEIREKQKIENEEQENEGTTVDEQTIKRVREQVIDEMSESLPAPGEPIFVLTLTEQDITPDADLSNPMWVIFLTKN